MHLLPIGRLPIVDVGDKVKDVGSPILGSLIGEPRADGGLELCLAGERIRRWGRRD